MNRRLSILFTANKALPDNDHRLIYGELSKVCSMTYALPGKPDTLDSSAYTRVNIGEGLRIEYLFHLVRLAAFVARNRNALRRMAPQFNLAHIDRTAAFNSSRRAECHNVDRFRPPVHQ